MFDLNKWVADFRAQPISQMSKEDSSLFINLMFREMQNQTTDLAELANDFGFKVLCSRAEHFGLDLSPATKVFLRILANSPGSIVMYLVVLRSIDNSFNLTKLAETFPHGFPTEESLSKMWDAQKSRTGFGGNCVDAIDPIALGWRKLPPLDGGKSGS